MKTLSKISVLALLLLLTVSPVFAVQKAADGADTSDGGDASGTLTDHGNTRTDSSNTSTNSTPTGPVISAQYFSGAAASNPPYYIPSSSDPNQRPLSVACSPHQQGSIAIDSNGDAHSVDDGTSLSTTKMVQMGRQNQLQPITVLNKLIWVSVVVGGEHTSPGSYAYKPYTYTYKNADGTVIGTETTTSNDYAAMATYSDSESVHYPWPITTLTVTSGNQSVTVYCDNGSEDSLYLPNITASLSPDGIVQSGSTVHVVPGQPLSLTGYVQATHGSSVFGGGFHNTFMIRASGSDHWAYKQEATPDLILPYRDDNGSVTLNTTPVTATFPASVFTQAGTYEYQFCADTDTDWQGLIHERNELDNCTGGDGAHFVVVDTPATAPSPTVSITANPTSINSGDSSTLSWSSTNATSCSSTDFATGNAASGSVRVTPSSTATYNISCSGDGGTALGSVTVTVSAPPAAPTASITISPGSIDQGDSASLSWSCGDSTSSSGDNFSTGGALSGTVSVSPTQTTSYTVWCNGPGGTTHDSQALTVGPKKYPDLTAQVGPAASGYSNENIPVSGTILNGGSASTRDTFKNMFQVCSNKNCDGYNVITEVSGRMQALAPNEQKDIRANVTVPNSGDYFYRACADLDASWHGVVDEGSDATENNNCSGWQDLSVKDHTAPDLIAGAVSPSTATPGQPVTFMADAINNGNGNSGSFPVMFQIKDGDTFTSNYISLVPNDSKTVSAQHTFAESGEYSIRACANFDHPWAVVDTSELKTDNNCGDWTTISVTAVTELPDLEAGGAPSVTVGANDPVALTGSVTNIGAGSTGGSFANLFRVKSVTASDWTTFKSGSIGAPLGPKGSGNDSEPVEVKFSPKTFPSGNYLYQYCVNMDLDNGWAPSVPEAADGGNNNCSAVGSLDVQQPQQPVDNNDNNNNGNDGNNNNGSSCKNALKVTLTASPTTVSQGKSAKLSWTAEGMNQQCTLTSSTGKSYPLPADKCTEDSPDGGFDTGAITKQTVFTLNCGSGGTAQAVVNVVPKFNEF